MTRLRLILFLACAVLAGAITAQIRSAVAYPILDPGVGAVQGSGYPSFGADIAVTVNTGVSTTSGLSALSKGLYAISCSGLVFADQGVTGVEATTSERRIPAGYVYPIRVDGVSDDYLALIGSGGPGVCVISKDGYR